MNSPENTALCFTQLLGQAKAKRLLVRTLDSGRLPHAMIFKGPEGVGKSQFARGFAAAINCRDVNRIGACGVCSSCKKFKSGNHPDFEIVAPEKGVIKIDRVRELSKKLSYPPYESKARVVLLEDVHTMRREAANSLLKTLEEPPPNNVLLLTVEASQEILATLTSRCQVVPFFPLSMEETTAILIKSGLEKDSAGWFAQLSEGSPGKALLFHKNEIVEIWKEIVTFLSDSQKDNDREIGELLQLAQNMVALKDDLPLLLGLLRLWLRDLLLFDSSSTKQMIFAQRDSSMKLKSWSSSVLFAKLQAIDRAQQELVRNCNKNLVCEVLLFKLQ